MSNGEFETRVANLETGVSTLQTSLSTLQNTMATLITNLGKNNNLYLTALDVLAHENDASTRTNAVTTARDGICTTPVPGCHD